MQIQLEYVWKCLAQDQHLPHSGFLKDGGSFSDSGCYSWREGRNAKGEWDRSSRGQAVWAIGTPWPQGLPIFQFFETKGWFLEHSCLFFTWEQWCTQLCQISHARFSMFPQNVGKWQGDEAELKANRFHHPLPLWQANDIVAKQARDYEQEITFIILQYRHEEQGSRTTREVIRGEQSSEAHVKLFNELVNCQKLQRLHVFTTIHEIMCRQAKGNKCCAPLLISFPSLKSK